MMIAAAHCVSNKNNSDDLHAYRPIRLARTVCWRGACVAHSDSTAAQWSVAGCRQAPTAQHSTAHQHPLGEQDWPDVRHILQALLLAVTLRHSLKPVIMTGQPGSHSNWHPPAALGRRHIATYLRCRLGCTCPPPAIPPNCLSR
jgi:hypothetical protein